jgi:hypothetical protein
MVGALAIRLVLKVRRRASAYVFFAKDCEGIDASGGDEAGSEGPQPRSQQGAGSWIELVYLPLSVDLMKAATSAWNCLRMFSLT